MRTAPGRATKSGVLSLALVAFIACGFPLGAQAATRIVALGASNTVGRGGASYPTELQAMLRAKGYDVEIINAGVNGDTTAGMLARLDAAVPTGTRLVLLNPANLNDNKAGIRGQQAAYVGQIKAQLGARGIKVIVLPSFHSIGAKHTDSEHFGAEGYQAMATRILPEVMAALGSPHH
jgi:acyl-CoA thioesterase-1